MSSVLFYSTRIRKSFSEIFFRKFFEVTGKSNSTEKCKRGDPLGFFEHQFFGKIDKKRRGLEDIEKICEKKSHKAEITCTKKLVKGESRTHVLLLGRPQKILIILYANWQWKLH